MTNEIQQIKKDILELLKTDNSNLNVVVVPIEQGCYSVSVLAKENSDFKIKDIDIVKRINSVEKIKRIFFNNIVFDKSFDSLSSMINIISCNNHISTQEQNSIIKNNNTGFYFENCIFEMQILFIANITCSGLCFDKCVFSNSILINSSNITSLSFDSCNLKEGIVISNTRLLVSLNFENLINKDILISFVKVEFQSGIEFVLDDKRDLKELKFEAIVFKEPMLFHNIFNLSESLIYKSKVCMNDIVFEEPVQFMQTKFKNGFEFSNVTFKKEVIFTEDFINANYNKNAIFNNLTFYKKFNFKNFFNSDIQEIEINNCNFKDKFEFPKQKEYKQKIKIIDTIFDDRVDFVENAFLNDLMIKNCVFSKDLSFKQTKFIKSFDFIENKVKDNIDFSDVSFEISPNFQSSIFEKLVILYKTKFKEIPNFYSASFSSSAVLDMPLVDIKDYSFNHLKYEIKNKNDLIDIKGIRECLNIFKNALLKTNNILEASKYKVLELYTKELELDYKLKNKENKEEKITIKERFDRWFLKLNRATSDHHTDFLKILLFTLSVIGGYFMINFGLSSEIVANNFDYLVGKAQPIENYTKMVFNSFDLKNFAFSTLCVLCFIVYITLVLTFSKFKKLLGILGAVGIIGILCSPNIITPFLGAFSEDARNHYLYKAIDDLDDKKALELARIILPNDKDLKEFKPSKAILSQNAKLEQISIFDKTDLSVNFIYEQSNQDKNEQSIYKAKKILKDYKDELKSSKLLNESPELKRAIAIDGGVSRLNIAYYLVLAFCIFALQKTMRKNSIIPS
ncbi:hypothetical protein KJQ97_05385 [Campylobacter sp. 2018MI01]|uniref:hypothetical protein n=1 Tax=Campylobacter sp. 2018MI01 TaxID=2836735 RepID=UPI001BD98047|nr:hypothetical protein [Campylobacter sp. 2018MI01]MBT0878851.1 hypothetical protein [Campylobacter sp. 2018MI01]